jgi:tRNA A37 threonylcarbamoyladenosine modification protein TsaB
VSTLEALAETARDSGALRVATALDAGRGEAVIALYSLAGARAVPESPPERTTVESARERIGGLPLVSLPADLVAAEGRGPAVPPSRALALAVARAPGKITPRLAGIYSRPSAAEEKHGAA